MTTHGEQDDTSWVEELSKKKDVEKLQMEPMDVSYGPVKNTRISRFTKVLIVLFICAAAAAIVLAVKLANTNKQDDISLKAREMEQVDAQASACDDSICTTPACVKAAAYMLKSMDAKVDPCEDFYEFACAGWERTREIPADSGHLAQYSELRNSVTLQLKGLLEEEEKEDDIESVKNTRKFYKSCLNEELMETVNTTGLIRLLDELQGWPLLGCAEGGKWQASQFDLQALIVTLQKYNNIPLISNWVGMDDKNNTKNVIFIDQIYLGMGSTALYLNDENAIKKQAYRDLIYRTAVLLGSTADDLDAQVDDVVNFETELAKIVLPSSQRRDWTKIYTPMTIAELQKRYTDPEKFPNVKFDWLSFLNQVRAKIDNPENLTESEVIVQQGSEYYTELFPLLNVTEPKTVANYLVWRIMKNRLRNLPVRFRDIELQYHKVMYGSTTTPPRWKSCVRYMKTPFKLVLGRLFVERYFSKESKTEVLDMIKNIISAFKEMVGELDWMDDDMKAVAKEKADYIVEVIGYPDDIFDDEYLNKKYSELQMEDDAYFDNVLRILQTDAKSSVSKLRETNDITDRRIWYTSPVTVNAFYHQQRNMITFPAGILQPTYFHVDHPRYLNYGGIGFMIGHEITHGFDDMDELEHLTMDSSYQDYRNILTSTDVHTKKKLGTCRRENGSRQYDKVGNLNDWWQATAAELYEEKGKCFINQYGDFVDTRADKKLNAVQNQGENIADNGGVKQTFRAYNNLIKTRGKPEKLLPGLNYTQDQLFFINFAQLRCDISSKADAVNHILNGYHSPNKFRVIGSLQNMAEFSEVFKCPVGSYMNPEDKCAVW